MPAKRSRPPLIGLTGTIGAGKSTALAAFARHGCAVLDADAVVHDLYRRAEVRDTVAARLGGGVIGRDGTIDRRGGGARSIFGDDELRGWLEGYIHPLVREAARGLARGGAGGRAGAAGTGRGGAAAVRGRPASTRTIGRS